jgi:nucleoside-diphosphate-sugar epimerase
LTLGSKNRTAIIFGARTALGSRLADHLFDEGVDVTVARRWNDPVPTPNGTRDAVASLEDDSLIDALIGKNWVFVTSLPGLDDGPAAFTSRAVKAVRNLVRAAREAGVDRIIVTLPASIAWAPGQIVDHTVRYVFGSASDPWVDPFYAVVQDIGYATAEGVDVTVVASALVVGPGVSPLRVSLETDARPIDVVHIDEAVRMHLAAAERAPWGATYLLGGHTMTRANLPDWIPAPGRTRMFRNLGEDPRSHLVEPGVRIDPARAVAELGFRPDSGF